MPTFLFRALHLPVLPEAWLAVLQIIWKLSLFLSCIGLFTRVNTIVAFVGGLYLLGLPHNFGKTHHFDGIIVFSLIAMALAKCGDGFSVDQLIRKKNRNHHVPAADVRISGEYTWPVRVIWLLLSIVFFSAGIAKITESGIEWMTSEHLQISLLQHRYHLATNDPLVPWGEYLAQYSTLCKIVATGTILLELGYPLALFNRQARYILVPSIIGMLIGIRLLMGPSFYQFIICSLFWIPWDRIYTYLAYKLQPQVSTRDKKSTNFPGWAGQPSSEQASQPAPGQASAGQASQSSPGQASQASPGQASQASPA
jgi:hypothetical protein